MSRQLEQPLEERAQRRTVRLHKILEYELVGSIAHIGGSLRGVNITFTDYNVLLCVKAVFEGKHMVCFVSEETLSESLIKCVRAASRNTLTWIPDKYPPKE